MYSVITGASSGLGKQFSYILAERGYDLILVARRIDRLEEIKQTLEKRGTNVRIFQYDLLKIDNCMDFVSKIKDLDVRLFINNAGFGQVGLFEKIPYETESDIIDLNIKSVHYLTKSYLVNFKNGIIVNISSMAAFLPTPLMSTYASSKSYVYNLSLAVNYELKKNNKNWKILTVAPGPVRTEFAEVANAKQKMKGMESEKCARLIIKGIEKKKELIIPGFTMKFVYFMLRFLPKKFVLYISYKIQSRK